MFTEDKSGEIKEALRQSFRNETSKMADRKCYGYNRATDGSLIINEAEAEIVRWIFECYRGGDSLGNIAESLEMHNILSPTENVKWSREAISKLLSNEKYVGSVLLQKTMSEDGYQVENQGKIDRVLIKNHHPAIFSTDLVEDVQCIRFQLSKNNT